MISFEDFEKLFSINLKNKYCIEIEFKIIGNYNYQNCYMGKMPTDKGYNYWYGLKNDGYESYNYENFLEFSTSPIFEGKSLRDIWKYIEILSIDGCEPIHRINYYLFNKNINKKEVHKEVNTNLIIPTPDVEVLFEFSDIRKTPVKDGYRPAHLIKDNYLTSGVHHYYNKTSIKPKEKTKGTITFISPNTYPNSLWIGKKINIQEGSKIVGTATILKIFNPILISKSKNQ